MQDTPVLPYAVRILGVSELDALLHLQEMATNDPKQDDRMQNTASPNNVVHHTQTAESYVPLSRDEFQLLLEGQGIVIGCFEDQALVAFHSIFTPDDHPDHLGYDLGMDATQCAQVAHLEAACVHPMHRGRGIQHFLTNWLIRYTREQGKFRYLLETVSPMNLASVKSTLKSGLTLQRYRLKYGGKKRFVFGIDLKEPNRYDESTAVQIAVSDSMEAFEKWFEQGYHGIKLLVHEDQAYLQFAKKIIE